jgi:CheY-like chemotaxis protein
MMSANPPVEQADQTSRRRAYGSPLRGLRILVVDDEPDARELMSSLLGLHGVEVTVAANVQEAMQRFTELPHDVLVSDIGMPEEDGYGLIRRIRELEVERPSSLPAIALTAYARPEDRALALSAGFDMHVAKPVEPRELLALLADLSGRSPRPL